MTSYTLFGNGIPAGTSSFTGSGPVDISLQVQATSDCQLAGYRWWVPSGGHTAGSDYTFRCYLMTSATTGTLVSGTTVTGSGTWSTEVWTETDLGSPVSLAAGSSYLLIATCQTDSRHYLHAYWASGGGASGITSGPVTAPSKAAALNSQQQTFNSPGTGAFFNGTSDGEWFSFDLVVSVTAASPPGLSLVPPGFASPMAWQGQAWPSPAALATGDTDPAAGTDSAAVTATASGADSGSGTDSGQLTATVSGSDTGSGADTASVSASLAGPDSGTGADSGAVTVTATGADTGSGTDTSSLAATVPGSDTGSGADAVTAIGVTGPDTGAAADAGTVTASLAGPDTGGGTDGGTVTASASGSDAGAGTDSGSGGLLTTIPPASRLGGTAVNANTYGGSAS